MYESLYDSRVDEAASSSDEEKGEDNKDSLKNNESLNHDDHKRDENGGNKNGANAMQVSMDVRYCLNTMIIIILIS